MHMKGLTSYDQSLALAALSFFRASNLELDFLLGPRLDRVDARDESGVSGTSGSSTSDMFAAFGVRCPNSCFLHFLTLL